MPTIILSALLGLCSAGICTAVGDIAPIEALAIYSITGTLSTFLLVLLPNAEN